MPLTGFHPAIQAWFTRRFGAPSPPQRQGWPRIRSGEHTLIAAPTGSGKTLAAFLSALDRLLCQGEALPDATQVLYVSPLKALGNDIQINLRGPLDEMRSLDPSLPEIRVLVRSGDTQAAARAAMRRRPPHILVTTPESLYILLTSAGGRELLRGVRTAVVDEIHAVAGDKRGAHLALSLERLEALAGEPVQRIGLSATQKPLDEVARLLVGAGRSCTTVDLGHGRPMDLGIEIPGSPLGAVCSHETWAEIHGRMAELIKEHRTTLVFANTRKLAERLAARLAELLGPDQVTSHHGSLARDRRLDAERRLKAGELRALVATASLELGIDIGPVDLVIQVGVTPSIATFLQRAGRAGHSLEATPRARLFPLTLDELACAAALLQAVRAGELDRTPKPVAPLDILAQQVVAACVTDTWDEARLYDTCRRAWPYRDLPRGDFQQIIALHAAGRRALLHRDGVNGRLRATRRARITALTSGGAIPDNADYQVVLEPEGMVVGSLNEDFAIESNAGDIFQLGNASWRILRVEPGVVRVADAAGQPPRLPFWLGEAPARTEELSAAVGRVRAAVEAPAGTDAPGLPGGAARQLRDYLEDGRRRLGAVPTPRRVIAERFFDEAGGMHLVLHAPFGGRINKAWGLALRKRFCRSFGFELQAAASEEAILLSLGPQHSFPLAEVFDYLRPETVRDVLVQAVLPTPLFATRWRWNASRALLLPRTWKGGKRLPGPILRMRADDLLAEAFPQVLACGETLPAGDIPVPWEHPLVRQTLHDCLHEAMDLEGLVRVLEGIAGGSIETLAVDTPEPSAFARGILNAMPYAFLDDAPLEERRTQAVASRHALDARTVDELGALDPEAVQQVRQEAWPQAADAEELHEALQWMGYVTAGEAAASGWDGWLDELSGACRVRREGELWFAAEAPRAPREVLRGRLEALGPVFVGEGPGPQVSQAERPLLLELEAEGTVLRCRLEGQEAFCNRRLLARIHRQTLERLRREIAPVSAAAFWRFLAAWQHADPEFRLDGPAGVLRVVEQLAGFQAPAAAWEPGLLAARVRGYIPDWLDQLALTGRVAWGRFWGAGDAPVRALPLTIVPREDLTTWLGLAPSPSAPPAPPGPPSMPGDGGPPGLSSHARRVLEELKERGASFTQELEQRTGLLPSHLEMGLVELAGHGIITCDSFGGLRRLITPASRRRGAARQAALVPAGRWALLCAAGTSAGDVRPEAADSDAAAEFCARRLLARYGVLFRRLLLRERVPVPWRDLARVCRHLELRGEVRGGRFVAGFSGEQFALPDAVSLLRRLRRRRPVEPLQVGAADPLNLQGILTPDQRIPASGRARVTVAG